MASESFCNYEKFHLQDILEDTSSFYSRQPIVEEWLLGLLSHHGMIIFGSTARNLVQYYDKYPEGDLQDFYHQNGSSRNIHAFFKESDDYCRCPKNSPCECCSSSSNNQDKTNDEDFLNSQRWIQFVKNLERVGCHFEKISTKQQSEYCMEIKVHCFNLTVDNCEAVIQLNIMEKDLTEMKHVQFDSDINAFGFKLEEDSDGIERVYMGDNEEWALGNLRKGKFRFLLNKENTIVKLASLVPPQHIRNFYAGVLISQRWCNLSNAGYMSNTMTVPAHHTAGEDDFCLFCNDKLKGKVWGALCCGYPMHHECLLRYIRTLIMCTKGYPNSILDCPACKKWMFG